MPTPASAIFRRIKYKAETTYGTIPALSGSQAIRRVEFSPDLTKDTFQSNELRTDQQIADFRHGARKTGGTLRGEVSPKAYADFLAAVLRKDFVATAALTGLSLTLAVSTHPVYTLTRGSGDFLTSGVKVGDVVRLTAGTWNAANLNVNLLVVGMTSTVLTVIVANNKTLTAEGPIASSTLTVVGKRAWVPTSGHTDKSFSIESWFSDLSRSEMYTGMKPTRVSFALPATGMATVEIEFAGQNVVTYTTEQFTSPTAAPSFGVAAAANGLLVIGGQQQTVVRDLSININGNYSGEPVVGSNQIPFQFPGRIVVDGQFTAYFDSTTLRDAFLNETEQSLAVLLTSDNSDNADFVSITLPRIKLGSASKNDAADGIVQTFNFQALLKSTGGSGTDSEQTTIVIQDSQA
jgi:hypothetical protein